MPQENERRILTPEELKQALLAIAVDFVHYCEENGLKYIMVGGTLLGAVRHKGFIPWDDDIDFGMPRDDYNRLHHLMREKPMEAKYKLYSLTAGNSANPFAKIVNTETEIINSANKLHPGLWIDIFPLDGIENNDAQLLQKKEKRFHRYAFLMEQASCPYGSGKSPLRRIAKIPVTAFARIRGAQYYGKKIETECTADTVDACAWIALAVWGGLKGTVKKEQMLSTCDMPFEGHSFKAPVGFDEYLTRVYGDYMTPPPESKRVNHGLQVVFKADDTASDAIE